MLRHGVCRYVQDNILCRYIQIILRINKDQQPHQTRPTLERRKTLGHIRSIDPNMIEQPRNFWKKKCLMAQLETTAWQYLRWPVAFFATNRNDLFFLHIKGNCEKWCLITKFEYVHVHGMTTLRQAVEMIWKNIHYIWFSHFTLTESHWYW